MKNKENKPLVSVIITTRNEEINIEVCLESIKKQSYKNIEIIVVDNNSTDRTKEIAYTYTALVFNKGPERSAQRNLGSKKANGKFLLFLDADMKVSKNVIRGCVDEITKNNEGGLVIPEESYGIGYWAACKKLERSFYMGNSFIEAARFFKRDVFINVKGFDTSLTGPEDWDLSQRVKDKFGVGRITSMIYHNEGNLSLLKTIQKKYYYSKKISTYSKKSTNKKYSLLQLSPLYRYKIYLSHPLILFKSPLLGLSMLFMKTLEFFAGFLGYLFSLK